MNDRDLTRRSFAALTAAAMGGLIVGCEKGAEPAAGGGGAKPTPGAGAEPGTAGPEVAAVDAAALLLAEPHVCCGLNACKGKGSCKTAANECAGHNECAGLSNCATANKHTCGGENACKGQGGCEGAAGTNACKGKGSCSIPLSGPTWKKVRAAFEAAYEAKNGKKPGGPPPECKQAS
ncbi:MAG: hypothetical protein GC159_03695 [Phycisphaera sp.]|nr:hypothetical protein [Phycisphaera sp.]